MLGSSSPVHKMCSNEAPCFGIQIDPKSLLGFARKETEFVAGLGTAAWFGKVLKGMHRCHESIAECFSQSSNALNNCPMATPETTKPDFNPQHTE